MQYPYIQVPYQYWGYNFRDLPKQVEGKKENFKHFFDLGDKAPDFTLEAVVNGQPGNVSLSDYIGKWVVLFFYSSDFTFV